MLVTLRKEKKKKNSLKAHGGSRREERHGNGAGEGHLHRAVIAWSISHDKRPSPKKKVSPPNVPLFGRRSCHHPIGVSTYKRARGTMQFRGWKKKRRGKPSRHRRRIFFLPPPPFSPSLLLQLGGWPYGNHTGNRSGRLRHEAVKALRAEVAHYILDRAAPPVLIQRRRRPLTAPLPPLQSIFQ